MRLSGHVVIGAGEVGTALAALLDDAYLRDIEPSGPSNAEVLHICIPYGSAFTADVRAYQRSYGARLVIVHSTVPVGTCDPNGWVHSPVRGRHPDLVDGLKTFVKHFGDRRADEAAAHFVERGIETHTTELAATTEAGKLWELTQYGLQVAVEKAIHAYCERAGVDFDVVYTLMAQTYNDGYRRLGHPEFVRPVLRHVPGPIGGHCVIPGARLLGDPLGDFVVAASKTAAGYQAAEGTPAVPGPEVFAGWLVKIANWTEMHIRHALDHTMPEHRRKAADQAVPQLLELLERLAAGTPTWTRWLAS